MARREVNLTGTRVHRALRELAAECTPNPTKRQERRERFDNDFNQYCPCGSAQLASRCGCGR